MIKNLLIVMMVLCFSACKTSTEEISLSDSDYLPLKVGEVKQYNIDSILYNPFTQAADSVHLDIQEQVVEKYLDAENDSAFRLTWSKYDSSRNEWKVFKSFSRKRSNNMVYETFDNQILALLRLPISQNSTGVKGKWNIHFKNTLDPMPIYYSSVFKPFGNYNNTVTTQLANPEQGIVVRNYQAVYAANFGLVYKAIEMTDELTGNKIKNGWIVVQSIK
jgi:hypothetical protein